MNFTIMYKLITRYLSILTGTLSALKSGVTNFYTMILSVLRGRFQKITSLTKHLTGILSEWVTQFQSEVKGFLKRPPNLASNGDPTTETPTKTDFSASTTEKNLKNTDVDSHH